MIEILIGVYGSILWLVFKKFKLLPVNTWTMVGAFLVGAFPLGFLLLMMNMYQPLTKDSRFMAATTPIVAEIRGKVIEVPVTGNTPLKAGDILFKIDPEPYQHALAAIEAQLGLARTRLQQETDLVAQGAAGHDRGRGECALRVSERSGRRSGSRAGRVWSERAGCVQ